MKYHIRLHDSKPDPRSSCDKQTAKGIKKSVATAFKMLNSTDADCYLVGGLEASILFEHRKGILPRTHTDIDVEVDRFQIPALKEGMEKHNYDLYKKIVSLPIPPVYFLSNLRLVYRTLTLYKEINSKEIESNNVKATELKLVKKRNDNILTELLGIKRTPLLEVIDVKVCERTAKNTTIYVNGKPLTTTRKYEGPIVEVNNVKVKCRNESYLSMIAKETGTAPYKFDIIAVTAPGKQYSQEIIDKIRDPRQYTKEEELALAKEMGPKYEKAIRAKYDKPSK